MIACQSVIRSGSFVLLCIDDRDCHANFVHFLISFGVIGLFHKTAHVLVFFCDRNLNMRTCANAFYENSFDDHVLCFSFYLVACSTKIALPHNCFQISKADSGTTMDECLDSLSSRVTRWWNRKETRRLNRSLFRDDDRDDDDDFFQPDSTLRLPMTPTTAGL